MSPPCRCWGENEPGLEIRIGGPSLGLEFQGEPEVCQEEEPEVEAKVVVAEREEGVDEGGEEQGGREGRLVLSD